MADKPVVERLQYRLEHLKAADDRGATLVAFAKTEEPPNRALVEATNHADRQWPKLSTYTLDGRRLIDNNLTKNAIRTVNH